jgi:hypothetical protein
VLFDFFLIWKESTNILFSYHVHSFCEELDFCEELHYKIVSSTTTTRFFYFRFWDQGNLFFFLGCVLVNFYLIFCSQVTKKLNIGRLNHVAIAVPNLESATAFYRDVLGAKVSEPQVCHKHNHSLTLLHTQTISLLVQAFCVLMCFFVGDCNLSL